MSIREVVFVAALSVSLWGNLASAQVQQVAPIIIQSPTIRLTGLFRERTSLAESARAFQSAVNERLVDAVRIVEPKGNLLEMVGRGDADIAVVPNTQMAANVSEEFVLFDLPFFFNNLADVERVQESPVGVGLLSFPLDSGLVGLGYWNGGMSQIFGRPITKAENLKGLKLGSSVSPPSRRAAEALGITIAALPPKVESALTTGEIDAVEVPPHFVAEDVVPLGRTTMSEVNYRALTYAVVANRKFWKGLPLIVQLTVAEQVQRIAKQATADAMRRDEQALATLQKREFARAPLGPENISEVQVAAARGWEQIQALTPGGVLNAALAIVREQRSPRLHPPERGKNRHFQFSSRPTATKRPQWILPFISAETVATACAMACCP
jgi:C4-dicarboxylate-binding protein DctP